MHWDKLPLGLGLLLMLMACATGTTRSPGWQGLDNGLGLEEVRADIAAHTGRDVVWGGRIVRSVNREEGTLLEILEQPLDSRGQPQYGDRSAGRFLVLHPGYLETLIYGQGRQVTVTGTIAGSRTLSLHEIEYAYPLIRTENISLWETEPEVIRLEHSYPFGSPSPYPYPYPYPWSRRWHHW